MGYGPTKTIDHNPLTYECKIFLVKKSFCPKDGGKQIEAEQTKKGSFLCSHKYIANIFKY